WWIIDIGFDFQKEPAPLAGKHRPSASCLEARMRRRVTITDNNIGVHDFPSWVKTERLLTGGGDSNGDRWFAWAHCTGNGRVSRHWRGNIESIGRSRRRCGH